MSRYVMRVTIFAPQAMIADANQLALCLGQSAEDDKTFGGGHWEDAIGNLYSVASTLVTDAFVTGAASQLVAPDFAPDVDLTAAGRAQAALVIYDPDVPVQAGPDRILAIINDSGSAAISIAGVSEASA